MLYQGRPWVFAFSHTQIKKVELKVHLYYVEKSQYPEDLSSLEGVSDIDLRCPVTKNIYLYDPSTGRISCPDHKK